MRSAVRLALLAAVLGGLLASGAVFALESLPPEWDPRGIFPGFILPVVGLAAAAGIFVAVLLAWLILPSPRPVFLPVPDASGPGMRTMAGSKSSTARHLMIGRLDPSLRWLQATSSLQRFLGCRLRKLCRTSFLDWIHPEDVAVVDRIFRCALAGEESQPTSFRMLPPMDARPLQGELGKDKSKNSEGGTDELPLPDPAKVQHVRMQVRPQRGPKGELLRYYCNLMDVTDVVRAELALRRRSLELARANERQRRINQDLERLKESYRDLYHNAPVMYFSLDEAGLLVTCNDTLLRTVGFTRAELHRRPFVDLLAPGSAAEWERQRRLAGTTPVHLLAKEGKVETLWRKKDGTIIDVWIHSIPVRDEKGRFVRSRSAALDVTERNRLAQELKARGDELEKTNARLRLINNELEDFTRVVSHDLKEPLRTLQAFSNILAEDFSAQLGPDGFEYINHLIQASRRLGSLIDDLLGLSSAGRIAGKLETFELIEVVATVRRDLVGLIQAREATVLNEGSLPVVTGDRQRIAQLLTNLVANGLKYNRAPEPRVVIGVASDPPLPPGLDRLDPGQVVIAVRDNGIGIDPQYHQQVFGIFRRLHRQDEFEGTGAGLAICKKIVQAHGGQIWVESEPGEGSTFYFTLPRPRTHSADLAPQPEAADLRPSEPMGRETRARTSSEAAPVPPAPPILLVEDHPDVALIVQRLCRRVGLEIVWFDTAEKALPWLAQHRPPLMLLDINLPGMSGLDLCREIRKGLRHSQFPIVLFSQDPDLAAPDSLRRIGATHVLSKDLLCQPQLWERKLLEILQEGRAGFRLPGKTAAVS